MVGGEGEVGCGGGEIGGTGEGVGGAEWGGEDWVEEFAFEKACVTGR